MESLKLGTLNINGLTSPTRVALLEAFIRIHALDILLLQEVTHQIFSDICGYNTFYNTGTSNRGTAIISRDALPIPTVNKIPSGRAIAANVRELSIVNIYALPGAAMKQERDVFFNSELTYLLRNSSDNMLFGGNFNCVLENADSTWQYIPSHTLAALVQGYALHDAWQAHSVHNAYTHYTASAASRLDRFSVTGALLAKKQGVETVAAAFADQLAVVRRLTLDSPIILRGRGMWKLNSAIISKRPI